LLLESDTIALLLGAAAESVTVPVDPLPPTTLAGFTVTDESVAAAGGRLVPSANLVTKASAQKIPGLPLKIRSGAE
jgi:hypothetical protein